MKLRVGCQHDANAPATCAPQPHLDPPEASSGSGTESQPDRQSRLLKVRSTDKAYPWNTYKQSISRLWTYSDERQHGQQTHNRHRSSPMMTLRGGTSHTDPPPQSSPLLPPETPKLA